MYYQVSRKKAITFKILYLTFSLLTIGFTVFIFFENLVNGFRNGLTFDEIILLIASLFAALFEGSITWFIIRSFKQPTILMKNLVFKNDGTPYIPGIVLVSIGVAIGLALAGVFFVSSFITPIFATMPLRAQWFLFDVGLIMLVNMLFTLLFYFFFRHESGSFSVI